jgi:hypothetical protein
VTKGNNGTGQSQQYWEIGGPIDRVTVRFILYGDTLDPDAITSRLGITPTKAVRKGDPTPSTHRDPRSRRRIGMWALESALPRSVELEQHLRHLLDIFDPVSDRLLAAISEGYRPVLSCGCFLDDFNRGADLSAETLSRIGALGATLRLDIYCCEEPGSDDGSDA